jgi:serine/threonine protein kinase
LISKANSIILSEED